MLENPYFKRFCEMQTSYWIMKFDFVFSLSIRILIGDTSGQIIGTSAEVTQKDGKKVRVSSPPKSPQIQV